MLLLAACVWCCGSVDNGVVLLVLAVVPLLVVIVLWFNQVCDWQFC